MIDNHFYSLLRVAFGVQQSLGQVLSDEEWGQLHAIAKKQAVVGICFSALLKLPAGEFPKKNICREWLAEAEPLRKQNLLYYAKARELTMMLSKVGFHSCILKGCSLATYYGDLAEYRSSGDIDVWVDRPTGDIVDYVRSIGVEHHTTIAHVECNMFSDVSVEIHPQPALIRCPWLNKRLKTWICTFDIETFECTNGFAVAPLKFNLVYLLVHIQHHLLFEGVGLRQFVDYFLVLRAANRDDDRDEFVRTISSLRMVKLAGGVMWIMQEVFDMDKEHILVEPDAKVGQLLLDEAMSGGNFGKYDNRDKMVKSHNAIVRLFGGIVRNARFLSIAPEVVMCNPFWRLWHFLWMKNERYR